MVQKVLFGLVFFVVVVIFLWCQNWKTLSLQAVLQVAVNA